MIEYSEKDKKNPTKDFLEHYDAVNLFFDGADWSSGSGMAYRDLTKKAQIIIDVKVKYAFGELLKFLKTTPYFLKQDKMCLYVIPRFERAPVYFTNKYSVVEEAWRKNLIPKEFIPAGGSIYGYRTTTSQVAPTRIRDINQVCLVFPDFFSILKGLTYEKALTQEEERQDKVLVSFSKREQRNILKEVLFFYIRAITKDVLDIRPSFGLDGGATMLLKSTKFNSAYFGQVLQDDQRVEQSGKTLYIEVKNFLKDHWANFAAEVAESSSHGCEMKRFLAVNDEENRILYALDSSSKIRSAAKLSMKDEV